MSRRNITFLLVTIVAIAVRCWKIDAPFTDPWSWRQSDVAAIARNYFDNGFHFARPQIDWAGDQPGFVGTEFPILPFGAAIAYKLLGVHEWIGRAETIALFAFSLPFFFAIVRHFFDQTAAALALVFYCFAPLSIATGRSFMPDAPALSFAIVGLYFFWRALMNSGPRSKADLLIGAVITSLSLLIKLPMATIAAPMASLAWHKFRGRMFRQPCLWLFGVIALLPSAIWYWHAHQLAEQFYPYHFFGGGGVRVMGWSWYWRIVGQTFSTTLTPVLFMLAAAGILISRKYPAMAPFRWWLGTMVLFIVIVGYGNRHQWYQLPLVPIAAAFSGAALSLAGQKWRPVVVTALVLALFLPLSIFFSRRFFDSPAKPLWELGQSLREHAPVNGLIVVADDGDPTALYYGHRKGWHFLERHGLYYGNPTDSAEILLNLRELRQRGATHLAFYRGTMWWLSYYTDFSEDLARKSVLEDATPNYRIYRFTQ